MNGVKRNAYMALVKKPEGKRPCKSVDNIEMDLTETGCSGLYWIDLAQDRK
jgi:hypothetical protein